MTIVFCYKDYDLIEHHLRVDLGVTINLPTIATQKSVNPKSSSSEPQVNPETQNNYSTPATVPSQDSQPGSQSNQYITPNGEVYSNTDPSSTR